MTDDPFARAAERAHAADDASEAAKVRRRKAQISSGARTAFRTHATVYVGVNLLLVAIWAANGAGYPWFIYPLLGWGIGLAAHYSGTSQYLRRSQARMNPSTAAAYTPQPRAAATDLRTETASGPTHPLQALPADTAPTSPGPGQGVSEELARLAELHTSGALNDAEFTAAKARLLS